MFVLELDRSQVRSRNSYLRLCGAGAKRNINGFATLQKISIIIGTIGGTIYISNPRDIQSLPTTSFLFSVAQEIFLLSTHRETLTQYITFKRGGRGESVLLYSVVMQLWFPASTPRCGQWQNPRRWDLYLYPSLCLILWPSRKKGAGDESEDSLEWLNPSPVKSPRLSNPLAL
jgi:hypothetical protein